MSIVSSSVEPTVGRIEEITGTGNFGCSDRDAEVGKIGASVMHFSSLIALTLFLGISRAFADDEGKKDVTMLTKLEEHRLRASVYGEPLTTGVRVEGVEAPQREVSLKKSC